MQRQHYVSVSAALLLGVSLVAQDWNLQEVYTGEFSAVLLRNGLVLVVGPTPPPNKTLEAFGLPPTSAAVFTRTPHKRIVTSRNRTQAGQVTVVKTAGSPRSRFDPLDLSWSVEAPGLAEFYISDNGATLVAATLDLHSQAATSVAIYDGKGALLDRVKRPRIRTVRLSTDGAVVVVSSEGGVLVLSIADRRVSPIGELRPTPNVEVSPKGDWLAVTTANGAALHRRQAGQFDATPTATVPAGVPTAVAFDDRSSHVAIVDGQKLHLFALDSRKVELSIAPSGPAAAFTSVDLSAELSMIAVGSLSVERRRTRATDGAAIAEVHLIRHDGTAVVRRPFPLLEWSAATPAITFFDQDRRLLITTPSTVHTLSLPPR